MAGTRLVTALTAVCVLLITVLSLIHTLDYFHPADRAHRFLQDFRAWVAPPKSGQTYDHLLGVGKADITGPVVEINFMGYADTAQLGTGLRQRIYSRAFIVGSTEKPEDRVVYVVLDTQSGDTAIRRGILDGLRALGDEFAIYGQQNVAITGTHSHSGPGAWLNYLLPQITSKGFDRQSYEAIVRGTVKSIRQAHDSLQRGRLIYGQTEVPDANINRSPFAYHANPDAERAGFVHDVDKELNMLVLRASDESDLGILTWFPVHGTSMLGNNTLVTGDNKGVAAYLFEQYMTRRELASNGFVAGFSQANVGDTSPNILGAFCESGPLVGRPCDYETSLCDGQTQPCHGRGPHYGLNDSGTASAFEIGRRQYVAARRLYESLVGDLASGRTVSSSGGSVVKALHVFVDLSAYSFTLPNGTDVRTCSAALGYSFAAGTSDGPGAFDFQQGDSGEPNANPVWQAVRNLLHKPDEEQIACQSPKPILLDVGQTTKPYLWSPNIVDVQLLRMGDFFVIVSSGEATTTAGRRWKASVANAARSLLDLESSGSPLVVLGGPANSYTHYIASEEEYGVQRYEGASTLYGPHTLAAYLDLTSNFIPYLSRSAVSDVAGDLPPRLPSAPVLKPGPEPPIHVNSSLNFISPVVRDSPGLFRSFGEIINDVEPVYRSSGTGPIQAIFVAANPRNDLGLDTTFLAVERLDESTGVWSVFRDDSDWSTVIEWRRTSTLLGTSEVKVRWELEWELGSWGENGVKVPGFADDYTTWAELTGRYRLRYKGTARDLGGGLEPFQGVSREFVIT